MEKLKTTIIFILTIAITLGLGYKAGINKGTNDTTQKYFGANENEITMDEAKISTPWQSFLAVNNDEVYYLLFDENIEDNHELDIIVNKVKLQNYLYQLNEQNKRGE